MKQLHEIEGLQFIPISLDKIPTVKGWQKTKTKYDFSAASGLGLVCGHLSDGLEAIDIDLKYDLTGTLYQRFKRAINEVDPSILPLLTVQRTTSGGYHFIYRCSFLEGNKKLAQRYATEEEQAKGEKIKVLIETRGEGGYIACYPTKGYELVFGSLQDIKELTVEQRNTLFDVAGEFNEVFVEYKPQERSNTKLKGLSPFEDYNNRADPVSLLCSHGWSIAGQKGGKTLLKRPGDSKARHSGNFDAEKNWFTVFTTSTEFDQQKAYLPYAVYAILECNGDFKEASRKLYEQGYGDRLEKIKENSQSTPSRISTLDNDLSFVATKKHYAEYLQRLRDGTFEMGKSTGLKILDRYFLFKKGNLVIINGHDNVGKSTVIWYIALMSAIFHGWKWIIFSSENTVGGFYRKMIEFYWCEPIQTMPEAKYKEALAFIEAHFTVIVSDEDLYNYKDIINMTKKIQENMHHHGLLIDPYNSLKLELTNASKLSTHEYHYEALSEIKLFGKQHNIAPYINCHAVTNALRQKDSDGFPAAPMKADTEGGGKFSNKADDFITIHRKVQHPEEWNVSELHIRKIKETETGGRVTPFDQPVKIRMTKNFCGFEEIDPTMPARNPILEWHQAQTNFSEAIEKQKDQGYTNFAALPPSDFDNEDTIQQYQNESPIF